MPRPSFEQPPSSTAHGPIELLPHPPSLQLTSTYTTGAIHRLASRRYSSADIPKSYRLVFHVRS